MRRKSTILDAISIPEPCPSEWDAMTGNRRRRFCQECNKHVYNLSAMTRDEAEALVARFEGRLCARIKRDAVGVILDDDLQAAPQLISRRASPVAAALVTALVGLSGNVLAITSGTNAPVTIHAQSDRAGRAPELQGATATISGVVTDSVGALIPGAKVTLINEKTGEPCGTTTSDDAGSFSFTSLAEGTYALKIETAGFSTRQVTGQPLNAGQNTSIEVALAGAERELGGVVAVTAQPLRALHQASDLIIIARLGRSASVKTTATNEMMKTTLDITSIIKGNNKRSRVTVYNWGWGEDKQFPGGLKTGDTALFFLKPRDQGDGFELSDYSYGVKKLAPADLQVYRQRLEELNAMAQAKPQDAAAIVEWLVRCAEQRATRWEGVYELAQIAASDTDEEDAARDSDEPEAIMAAAEKLNQIAASEPANSADGQTATTASTCSKAGDDARSTLMLSDAQKNRLKAALFNIDALAVEDFALLRLVEHWKDARFVPFLLEQLRRVEANPPRLAERIMDAIASAMHDEEVQAMAEDYRDNTSYEDLDAQEDADSSATETVDREDAETDDGDEPGDKVAQAMAARQARSLRLQRFVALIEKKRAN